MAELTIADRIRPVKLLPRIMAALIYGRSGTGKTTLAASFPKPALIIDIREKGTDSISNIDGIDVFSVDKWSDLEELYWYIKESKKYKSVILDQVSTMQDIAMTHVMEEEDKDVMSQRLWGMVGGLMKTWLLHYRDLIDDGINVCFIAHDRISKEGDDDGDDSIDPLVGPRLMPSVAGMLNGAVKVIGNTFVREALVEDGEAKRVEYCLRLAPHPYYITKMRNPLGTTLPEFVVDATYDKLCSLMAEGEVKPVRRSIAAATEPVEAKAEAPAEAETSTRRRSK